MQDNLNPTAQAEPPEASHGDGADAAPPMGLLTPSAEAAAALQPDPARAAQGTLPSAGAPIQLRQAREMAGLHVAVLASMLKVPVKKLEALEAGRFDQLPDLTFARALAQSVCRQLKVDPAPILAALPQPEETWRDTSDRALSAPFVPAREMGKPTATGEPRHVSKPTVLAVVLLVAAAVLWWSLPDRGLSVSEITLPVAAHPPP
jgi:cytoskeleton protein RodZ